MVVCNKCKQDIYFIVQDSYQICGDCGSTDVIIIQQNEYDEGIKVQKQKINTQNNIDQQSVLSHIDKNWYIYLEAFQRALRESVRMIKIKLNLDNSFDDKAKYYWFEYLKVYRENNIPLIGFFTEPRSGNNHFKNKQNIRNLQDSTINQQVKQISVHEKYQDTRYKQKKSTLIKIQQDEIEEEYLEERFQEGELLEENKLEQNFTKKMINYNQMHDQQKKVLTENYEIQEMFNNFEDTQRLNYEFQKKDSRYIPEQHLSDQIDNNCNDNIKQKRKKNQKVKQDRDVSNKNRIKLNRSITQSQYQNEKKQTNKNKKRKNEHIEGKLNYIDNLEDIGNNYFLIMLDKSQEYVKNLYNGFKSAYLHMLYLKDKEKNPLKRIKKLKEKSKCFSIPKKFFLKQIEKRNAQFILEYNKKDIIHLIWAWDWAEFISLKSSIQFKQKDNAQLLYDYLERMLQIIRKQHQDYQYIRSELKKTKAQLKLEEIFIEYIPHCQSINIKNKNIQEQIQDENTNNDLNQKQKSKNKNKKVHQYEINNNSSKNQRISSPANFVRETQNLNQQEFEQNINNQIEANNNISIQQYPNQNQSIQNMKSTDQKQDESNDISNNEYNRLLKTFEDFERQMEMYKQKRIINLNDEQILTLQIILEEILNESDFLCYEKNKTINPLFTKQTEDETITGVKKNKKDDRILSLEYHLIPTIIYISLYSIGETYTPKDINLWMKNDFFPYSLGISPYIKIDDALIYWLYPQSIPSSTFIRQHAKKFIQMTNHTINVSKKRIFRQSLKLISDFGLPLEWACIVNLICVRLYRDKHDQEFKSSDEFECDIVISAVFIVLLKMIYGLNDEMFGVLLNKEILEDAKEYLNEKQYSFLHAIILYFEHTTFRPTTQFYQTIPTFKEVSNSIQKYNLNQQEIDLLDYKQGMNLSYQQLLILLKNFTDKHKLSQHHDKKNQKYKEQNKQQQTQYKTQVNSASDSKQNLFQGSDNKGEILYIQQMRSHLSKSLQLNSNSSLKQQNQQNKIKENDHLDGTFSVNKKFNLTQKNEDSYKRFSTLFETDLAYIQKQVIIQGKTLIPPCFDYEIEKNYAINSKTLPNELKFIVDKLSLYTGEDTTKILHCLERIEGKIFNLIIKNTKPVQPQ